MLSTRINNRFSDAEMQIVREADCYMRMPFTTTACSWEETA